MTVGKLNGWPAPLRPIVQRFLPHTRELQQAVKDARTLIGGLVKEREALKAKGETPEYADILEWLPQIAKGRTYDPALVQLALSFVAIHTTADVVGQLLFDLIEHPEYIQPLRDEIITVLKEGGWKKNSLYNMKLLDSVLKESLRIRPINQTSIQRIAEVPITLSDGTKLSRNTLSIVPLVRHWDAEYYSDPDTFDGYRFYRLRQERGKENLSQFVSTSPDYLSFGHGLHACPGRFFASNEIKIIMCHVLLKYEWRLLEGAKPPQVLKHGFSLVADPFSSLEIRRRQEEIVIDNL
ncbi:Cytochrome P450 monooygenase 1 [Lachnellula cervina]|uniref:Cytochrome P450 monooygenase 1 n=1 Tax=Lachnellula cervina TaxID=1316786 RepID=A0A7D8YQ36_9HELO|nr:Cytochrome P450 monooygenase 1 [Lachnellula cervina]